jgi:hypothetical protein
VHGLHHLDGRVLEGRVYVWLLGGMALLFLGPSIHVLVALARARDSLRHLADDGQRIG